MDPSLSATAPTRRAGSRDGSPLCHGAARPTSITTGTPPPTPTSKRSSRASRGTAATSAARPTSTPTATPPPTRTSSPSSAFSRETPADLEPQLRADDKLAPGQPADVRDDGRGIVVLADVPVRPRVHRFLEVLASHVPGEHG